MSYKSDYPQDVPVDPAFIKFFEEFYKISDSPTEHEHWVQQFLPDATLVMASKKAKGSTEISTVRAGMWEKVSSRSHDPIQIYPFGPNSDQFMLHGTVSYGLKAGGSSSLEWAARAHLVKSDGAVKFKHYQVYLDTGAQQSKPA